MQFPGKSSQDIDWCTSSWMMCGVESIIVLSAIKPNSTYMIYFMYVSSLLDGRKFWLINKVLILKLNFKWCRQIYWRKIYWWECWKGAVTIRTMIRGLTQLRWLNKISFSFFIFEILALGHHVGCDPPVPLKAKHLTRTHHECTYN